jgi:hypothetical protein
MNNSWCRSYKKTPYELVYGDKPRSIEILDGIENLDEDMVDDLQGKIFIILKKFNNNY